MNVPTIRVATTTHEYLVFFDESGKPDRIIGFPLGKRIGTKLNLEDLPWSARWQVEQELSQFHVS